MEWQTLITDLFIRISQELERVLDGLSIDELNRRPLPDSNSIGWLAWHLTRSHDRNLSELTGRQQLWLKDNWYSRFNRTADPAETGVNHSSEDMAVFQSPDSKAILSYHQAVLELAKEYISENLSEAELDRKTESPTLKNINTVKGRLLGIISEGFQHAGQAAYVRGLITKKSWRN